MRKAGLVLPVILALAACGGSAAPSAAPTSPSAAVSAAASAPAKPAASAGVAGSTAASGLTPIKMVYAQNAAVQEPIFVAKDAGFWAKNGLDVEMTNVTGTAQVPAITSGQAQFANTGAAEVTSALLNGAPIVMIGTLSDLPIFDLYANKKYSKLEDLTGQSIGVTNPGTSTDFEARLILKKNGLTGKVKVTPAGGTFPTILAAMQQGGIAAGMIGPPFTAEAARNYAKLLDGLTLGPFNVSGLTATKPYLQANPDIVKRFLRGYNQAWTYAGDPANKTQVVNIVAKWTKSTPEDAVVGVETMTQVISKTKVPAVDPAAVESILSVSDDAKAQASKPDTFIDNSFINAAGS